MATAQVFQALGTEVSRSDGLVQWRWYTGCVVYAVVVYTVSGKAGLISRYWVRWTHL